MTTVTVSPTTYESALGVLGWFWEGAQVSYHNPFHAMQVYLRYLYRDSLLPDK